MLSQTSNVQPYGNLVFIIIDFQISPLHRSNESIFVVRKELTPSVNGDTKCSVYLQHKLDFEKHASYIMQIIAEVLN